MNDIKSALVCIIVLLSAIVLQLAALAFILDGIKDKL